MTMLETQIEAEQSLDLLADNTANEWWNPEAQSSDDLDAVTALLEALFHVEEPEEKRDYPHELSALIKAAFGTDRLTFIVNGGDGSLLTAFDPAYCFGIEPEEKRSRKRQGRYHSIVGDLPRVGKLLDGINQKLIDTIVDFREGTNAEALVEFLNTNVDPDSHVFQAFIDHGDDNEALIKSIPGVYCAVAIQEPDITIYFASDAKLFNTLPEGEKFEIPRRTVTADTIDLLGSWVTEQRYQATRDREYRYRNVTQATATLAAWKAIHREYGRRFVREARTYDVDLVGGRIIDYQPSDWTKMAVEAYGHQNLSSRIHKRDVSYFGQHSGLWRELLIMEDLGLLLIDPLVKEKVAPIINEAERATTPLRPLKPQERLGYLSMQSRLKCIRSDAERGFEEGRYYRVSLREEEYSRPFTKNENVKGVLQLVKKERRYLHQRIFIDNHSFYDDDPEAIKYILSHFDVPNPGDIRSRYPELVAAEEERIDAIQAERLHPRGFALKAYQRNDLAALSVHNRAILAHQQGLGKSVEGLMFALTAEAKAGHDLPVLLICPQDLIPQWQREAKEKYGIELTWIGRHKGGEAVETVDANGDPVTIAGGAIKNLLEARRISKAIKGGATGWYVTHFEALTMGGARNLVKIEEPYVIRIKKEQKWVKGGWRTDPETKERKWFESSYEEVEKEITSATECPKCGGALGGSLVCRNTRKTHPGDLKARKCGWHRYTYRLPNIGQILSTTFKNGVIIVDEGTQIASARNTTERNASQKTKAVIGMRAANRLVMSGTPIKNFIAQAYWLLWWGVGGKERGSDGTTQWSSRFPYPYFGGKKKFAEDYTVLEWTYNEETNNWANVKEVGEVTNHTRLWAQLAAVLLRRVKEETGELIPRKETHVLHVPLGYYQREQMEFWLENFPDLFAEKYPDDPKVKRGSHVSMAPMLGLDVKLNYAAVMPKADPDWAWTTVPVSNFTPAVYKTLTTIMALVKQGRQVLVGTDVRAASGFLAAELNSKGISARTLLNNSGQTLDPPERAKVVEEFQNGGMVVLCSTQKAIRLGHNLDKGSAVVLLGLDWDYETYAQFTERVHRLTSELPVDAYVIVPGEENLTLVGRKWDVIQDKAKGASMAIDGQLPEQNEEPPDVASVLKEMIEKGIAATGKEVEESRVAAAWAKVPQIDQYVIPEGFAEQQAKPWVIDWDAANKALEERLALVAKYEAEEAEIADANWRALFELCQPVVEKGVCDALDAFFEGATQPIEELVTPDTKFSDSSPIAPGESEAISDAGELSEAAVSAPELVPPAKAPASVEEDTGQLSLLPEPELAPPAPSLDIMGQLREAAELHTMGVLTDEEFAAAKADLLALLKPGYSDGRAA